MRDVEIEEQYDDGADGARWCLQESPPKLAMVNLKARLMSIQRITPINPMRSSERLPRVRGEIVDQRYREHQEHEC